MVFPLATEFPNILYGTTHWLPSFLKPFYGTLLRDQKGVHQNKQRWQVLVDDDQKEKEAIRKLTMSTWLAENPEMLQAALEIVDSWDNGGILWGLLSEATLLTKAGSSDSIDDGDTSVSSWGSSGVDSPKRLPSLVIKPSKIEPHSGRRLKTSTKISTQNRRRAEIKSLRAMSMELERQLTSLQTTARGGGNTREDMASVWRDIAQRQQQLRSLAEAKQWSLRCRLHAQMNIERELVRLFQTARAMEVR
jgi:hypothetical protein